ncbi:MAG: tetratricopeptide repeat protein [Candidatus Hydrothermarchaeaceae archaeon]
MVSDEAKKIVGDNLGEGGTRLLESGKYGEVSEKLWSRVGEAKKFFPKKEWYGGVSYSGALIWVGEDYARKGDYESAIGYFEKVTKEDPKREKAWENLAMALICEGFRKKDAACFERALELKLSKDAENLVSLGLVSLELGEEK